MIEALFKGLMILVGAIVLANVCEPPEPPGASPGFDQVQAGMMFEQVVELMGRQPDSRDMRLEGWGYPRFTMRWEQPDGSKDVVRFDGKQMVQDKAVEK